MVFLYLVWRKLREDMDPRGAFGTGMIFLLMFYWGGRFGYGLTNRGLWGVNIAEWFMFWKKIGFNMVSAYITGIAGLWWYFLIKKWKVVASLETVMEPVMWFIALLLFVFYLSGDHVSNLWVFTAVMIVLWLNMVWAKKYRSFYWYRSGKKGFVFMFSNIVFWILMALLTKMSLISGHFVFVYLVISLISGVGLVILSYGR